MNEYEFARVFEYLICFLNINIKSWKVDVTIWSILFKVRKKTKISLDWIGYETHDADIPNNTECILLW